MDGIYHYQICYMLWLSLCLSVSVSVSLWLACFRGNCGFDTSKWHGRFHTSQIITCSMARAGRGSPPWQMKEREKWKLWGGGEEYLGFGLSDFILLLPRRHTQTVTHTVALKLSLITSSLFPLLPPRLKHQSLFLPHSVCLWRFFLPDFVSSSSSSPSFPLLCVCFLARLFISSPAAGWHFILFPPHSAALLGLAQLLQPYSVTHFTLLFPHARMHTCIHTH